MKRPYLPLKQVQLCWIVSTVIICRMSVNGRRGRRSCRGTAADEGDGLIARHLQTLHQAQGHEMTHVQAVCGGIKANIKYRFSCYLPVP